MNYLQEIIICTSNNIQFTCHIISSNNSAPFGAESLIFDPRINTIYSSLHPIGKFNSANDAYDEIIKFCINYSAAAKVNINKIDNPCNAPFISKNDQQPIVNANNLTVRVLVNGK